MLKLIATCALGAVTLCPGTAAMAQGPEGPGAGGPPPLSIQVLGNMGRAGLLGTMASNERYGAVQSRVAFGRGISALANIPGNPADGYSDGVSEVLTPLSALVRLNKGPSESASYLRFTSTNRWSDGWSTETNGTEFESDSEAHGFAVQYLYAPNPDLMLGIGVEMDRNAVDIRHNDGESDIDWWSIRADVLKVLNPNWGLAFRASWHRDSAETSIPLPFATLDWDQDSQRLYLQADAVGTFGKADLPSLPEGWILRPHFGAQWQKTWFDETTNSLGGTVVGPNGKDSDEYGSAYAKLSLAKAGPGKVLPYVGIGLDHEFTNSYDEFIDESTYFNSFAGATIKLTRSSMLNVSYSRYDGFNGNRTKEAVVVAFGVTF